MFCLIAISGIANFLPFRLTCNIFTHILRITHVVSMGVQAAIAVFMVRSGGCHDVQEIHSLASGAECTAAFPLATGPCRSGAIRINKQQFGCHDRLAWFVDTTKKYNGSRSVEQ